ncbi:MAG TPA: isoprenylcysteine carboxylmethyltransferase family protein [Acidobacteriaceae bacterium]|jgi:protein-S-isoprenylcysteine O-methyltransferase Ste14|nr:isoprenylcysteine carboxylmethyltransferase family protein [Acidobacteriaceae bacterium]
MLWIAAVTEMGLCWIVWTLAFIKPRRQAADRVETVKAKSSRLGLGLVMAGFALTWAYVRPNDFHKSAIALIASMVAGPLSVALVWWATRHLGKQWRYQAALRSDHELIQSGPYAWMRHPIYTSMLGMLLATGLCWTWWPMLVGALVCFVAGTEIRVRAEDQLLEDRFQAAFVAYRQRVPAYLPFLR